MKYLKLFESFENTNLKSFINQMYGPLRRAWTNLDQEYKEKVSALVDKLYSQDSSVIDQFKSTLGKVKSIDDWRLMIIHLEEFLSNYQDSGKSNLESSPFLLSSKDGVYLFSMGSYESWISFLEDNKWLYKEIKWPFNPKFVGSSEEYFNGYLDKFPIFCLIIDTNNNSIYGASLNSEGKVGVSVDKNGTPLSKDKFFEYLDQVGLSIEDL